MMSEKINLDEILEEFMAKSLKRGRNCPSDETLMAYVHGELDPEKVRRVEAHLEGCEQSRFRVMRFQAHREFWDDLIEKDMSQALALALGSVGFRRLMVERLKSLLGGTVEAIENLIQEIVPSPAPDLTAQPAFMGEEEEEIERPELEVNMIPLEGAFPAAGGPVSLLDPEEPSSTELRQMLRYAYQEGAYAYAGFLLREDGSIDILMEPTSLPLVPRPIVEEVPAGSTAVMIGLGPEEALSRVIKEIRESGRVVHAPPEDASLVWVVYGKGK